jgi:hypothetical protein
MVRTCQSSNLDHQERGIRHKLPHFFKLKIIPEGYRCGHRVNENDYKKRLAEFAPPSVHSYLLADSLTMTLCVLNFQVILCILAFARQAFAKRALSSPTKDQKMFPRGTIIRHSTMKEPKG